MSYTRTVQNSILDTLATGAKTHREIHVAVSSFMAWQHGIRVTPQNVRSRCAELVSIGMVKQAGTTKSHRFDRTVNLWTRA
jgi:hypothetical protein